MEQDLAQLLGQTSLSSSKDIDESDDDWLDNKRKHAKKGKRQRKSQTNSKESTPNTENKSIINNIENVQYVELLLNQEINCLIILNLKVMQLHHRNQNQKEK